MRLPLPGGSKKFDLPQGQTERNDSRWAGVEEERKKKVDGGKLRGKRRRNDIRGGKNKKIKCREQKERETDG